MFHIIQFTADVSCKGTNPCRQNSVTTWKQYGSRRPVQHGVPVMFAKHSFVWSLLHMLFLLGTALPLFGSSRSYRCLSHCWKPGVQIVQKNMQSLWKTGTIRFTFKKLEGPGSKQTRICGRPIPVQKSRTVLPGGQVCWLSVSSAKQTFALDEQVSVSQIHQPDCPCRKQILWTTALTLLELHWCLEQILKRMAVECGSSYIKRYNAIPSLCSGSALSARTCFLW